MLVIGLNQDGQVVNRQLVHSESHAELDSFYERIALINCHVQQCDIQGIQTQMTCVHIISKIASSIEGHEIPRDILDTDDIVDGILLKFYDI